MPKFLVHVETIFEEVYPVDAESMQEARDKLEDANFDMDFYQKHKTTYVFAAYPAQEDWIDKLHREYYF